MRSRSNRPLGLIAGLVVMAVLAAGSVWLAGCGGDVTPAGGSATTAGSGGTDTTGDGDGLLTARLNGAGATFPEPMPW